MGAPPIVSEDTEKKERKSEKNEHKTNNSEVVHLEWNERNEDKN